MSQNKAETYIPALAKTSLDMPPLWGRLISLTPADADFLSHFELPAGSAAKGLGVGATWYRMPLWIQKSWGPSDRQWTSYGGGGLWLNPGPGNRNYGYVGWQVQRRLSHLATLGTEIFYTTPDQVGGGSNLRFNVGLVLDFNEHHHLLLSAGRGIVGDTIFQGYLAYQMTI